MDLKRAIKKLIKRSGYTVTSNKWFPYCVDLCADIKRLPFRFPVQMIFDVGANIGQTSIYFASEFPQAQIFAFEPIDETFQKLIAETRHLTNVRHFNFALGSRQQQQDMFLQSNSQLNSLVEYINVPASGATISQMVTVKTIDCFCEENDIRRIDILKTDTEGFDLEVLQGAEGKLEDNSVMSVFAEVGFSESDKRHTYFLDLKEYLNSKHFKFYGLFDAAHYSSPISLDFCNALFINETAVEMATEYESLISKNG